MKVSGLLPIFRSSTQGALLADVYLHPEEEFTMTDLAQRIGAPLATVHHEAVRLIESGLIVERRVGRSRVLRAPTDSILTPSLTELLALTYGPRPVLAGLLSTIAGIDEAWIFGSWAARFDGVVGPPPGDIDVLVVGTCTRTELDSVAEQAERILHREVNIRRVNADEWHASAPEPFIAQVRHAPRVRLDLGDA